MRSLLLSIPRMLGAPPGRARLRLENLELWGGSRAARTSAASASVAVDLVEDAAVLEMRLLRLRPAAERFVDREQLHLRELAFVFLGRLRVARAIEMLAGDVLALWTIKVREIGLGDFTRAVLVHVFVDDGYGRLGQD